MKFPGKLKLRKNGNWGLKLLSLVLAVVIYYAIKSETANGARAANAPQHDSVTK